jgi:hypothetical protein
MRIAVLSTGRLVYYTSLPRCPMTRYFGVLRVTRVLINGSGRRVGPFIFDSCVLEIREYGR